MAAIALAILRAERRSHLFHREQFIYRSPDSETEPDLSNPELHSIWYAPFARLLFSQVSKSEPQRAFENIRFIIFNYDRCLEQFLWMALQAHFDIDASAAALILQDVDFLHPYGSLGPLPWQDPTGHGLSLGDKSDLDYFQIGSRLRTFTESVRSDEGDRVKSAIAESQMLLFLGFGFLDQNIELLAPAEEMRRTATSSICTAYGISHQGYDVIRYVMTRFLRDHTTNGQKHIEPATCTKLFQNFDMHLKF